MQFIDSHCHLDFAQFDDNRQQIIDKALAENVMQIVIPGVEQQYWQRQISLCQTFPNLHFALGIHPYFLDTFQHRHIHELDMMLNQHSAIAVGECGIDGVVDNIDLQTVVFNQQIELANKHKLPLIVHHRKSHHHILSSFKQIKPKYGGVIHAFSGSISDAKKYVDLGFKLGIGGVITYHRATKTIETIKHFGLSHLVLETDAPDMPLNNVVYQSKPYRNEPANVASIAQTLAEMLKQDIGVVAEVTTLNCERLFQL